MRSISIPLTIGLIACGSGHDDTFGGSGEDDGMGGGAGAAASGNAGGTSGGNPGGGGGGFPGSGTSYSGAPLSPGQAPTTAGDCSAPPAIGAAPEVESQSTICLFGETANPDYPAATIEQIVEVVDGRTIVHIRITFDPGFVDNTYGDNAVGWGGDEMESMDSMDPMDGKMMKPGKSGHTFKDLVGSDHVALVLTNGAGEVAMDVKVDYISEDPSSPCGYATLGVTGGEGKVNVGSAEDVLAVATSLDRNLNGCGFCLVESSPSTDSSYTPSDAEPEWDYRVVYELWIDAAAFGDSGFGEAHIESVHASPSKLPDNTVPVTPQPCPPEWPPPNCIPSLSGEGYDCGTGAGGSGGSGGVCPPGYVPDLQTEGRTCVPAPR